MKKLAVVMIVVLCAVVVNRALSQSTSNGRINMADLSLIPIPSHTRISDESFTVTPETRIFVDPEHTEVKVIGAFLADKIYMATGFNVAVVEASPSKGADHAISLTLRKAKKELGQERL